MKTFPCYRNKTLRIKARREATDRERLEKIKCVRVTNHYMQPLEMLFVRKGICTKRSYKEM